MDQVGKYTRIKLCWFESLDAAFEASFIGADFLGFHVFKDHDIAEKTARFARILGYLPPHIGKTLLTDLEVDPLVAILKSVPFDSIQLYPDWPTCDIEILRTRVGRSIKIFKVMSANSEENYIANDREFLQRYEGCVDAILLDSFRRGGTGSTADWNHCRDIVKCTSLPILLAGGLTPDNVAEAIRTVGPFGVDVESGVSDIHPDKTMTKNLRKCRAFVDAVMRTDRELIKATEDVV